MDNQLTEKIRKRAHELYLKRQGKNGSSEQDWLEAEKEIAQQESKSVKSKPQIIKRRSATADFRPGIN